MADSRDSKKTAQELINLYKKMNDEISSYQKNSSGILTYEQQRALIAEQIANQHKLINELQRRYSDGNNDILNDLQKARNKLNELTVEEKQFDNAINTTNKNLERQKTIVRDIGTEFVKIWKHLQDQDKIIKNTIRNLGISGAKAELMRGSFERSAGFVTRLGGTLEDAQKIMEGFADETGRARVLSTDMVKDIISIGKGTGLGVEQATKLGAQFEAMGISASGAMDYVQGVVDTSERMGVNTTKVLKNIGDNFKKLQTYNFQQGVKGFAQMAMHAEKFKVDISDALNAADTARTLEGAIDMVAQLQVMGGEFAKLDMFETLYFARNDPAKLQAKIGEMTKGIVTLRKNSDGTFEKFISPADRDRLNAVGKALGISNEKMTEMALRAFDFGKMAQQLSGMGLTDREKELIKGAAFMNEDTGRFQVELAGTMTDISKLTAEQAKSFASEQVLLQDRAKQAMTFDETFKATVETLKSALLPVLKLVNGMLKPLSWIADQTSKLAGSEWKGAILAGAALTGAALLWKTIALPLMQRISDLSINKLANHISGRGAGALSGTAAGGVGRGWQFTKTGTIRKGASELTRAQGMKNLGTGAGIGAAAVGIGAGVGVAAVGISKLADSMSKLTPEQAKTLETIATTLAITFPAAAIGIGIMSAFITPAIPAMLALGAAVLMIGGAIGIAATGIGYMGKGLAEMFNSVKGNEDAFLKVAMGIGGLSLALGTAGITAVPAALGLSFAIGRIAKHAESINKVGEAFANIKAVMSGSKDDFIAIENAIKSISNMNMGNGGMLAELATLLKTPLKVEFVQNSVPIKNNITLELDGKMLLNKSLDGQMIVAKHIEAQHGRNKPS